jgi:thymidylate synthase
MEKRSVPTFPHVAVNADTLAGGFHHAAIGCYEQGLRVQTPKHREGLPLGYDAHVTVTISDPLAEPLIHRVGLSEDPRGVVQYVLEVTHGIHDHWKKDPDNPDDLRWGYTYHERFDSQIPFALAKIKDDFQKKGRATGRDYFFTIWRPEEDSILDQPDPPCFQNGQFRLINEDSEDPNSQLFLHYLTHWRSRDGIKAWNENNLAQVKIQGLMAQKLSNMLEREVQVGSYTDTSNSWHIYGAYVPEGIEESIRAMKKETREEGINIFNEISRGVPLIGPVNMTFSSQATQEASRICPEKFAMDLGSYLYAGGGEEYLKRVVAAQLDAENQGHGQNLGETELIGLGYDLEDFSYPKDWDSWPKEWDQEPDPALLRGS